VNVHFGRFVLGALIVSSLLGAAACSDASKGSGGAPTTIGATPPEFVPELPAGANPMPYVYGALVGAGTWKFRIVDQVGPDASGNFGLQLWIENGTLDPQSIEPEAFMVYDDRLRGTAPTAMTGEPEIAGAESREVTLRYEVDAGAIPSLFVFRGSQFYGPPTQDSIVSLDPDFEPQSPT
jgi:hypothetical protein